MNKLIRTIVVGYAVAKAVDYLNDKHNRKKVMKFIKKNAPHF
jgi:hypothetical protein